ncbi:MAG: hypothetical protein ACLPLR_11490, partial [Terriglobales bacterium]
MGRIRVRDRIVYWVTLLLMVTGALWAQDALPAPGVGNPALDPWVQRKVEDWAIERRGVPDDWTHHYVIFSNPGTEQQALESGNYEQWLSIVNDPRFILQQVKRSRGAQAMGGTGVSAASTPTSEVLGTGAPNLQVGNPWRPRPWRPRNALKKDWAVAIGGLAATGTGTVTTNNASATSTVTVDGQTLNASAPTAATASGIFTSAPAIGQRVTITNGATNTLVLTPSGSASSVVGTVAAAPTSTIAPTITITNSAVVIPNTLTLTAGATGATATGTVSSTGPTTGQTITIKNATTNNTLTLQAITGTFGTGTVSVTKSVGAANGDVGTVGSVEYVFEETTTPYTGEQYTGAQYYCPSTTSPCVWWGTTEANTAQVLLAAITNNPSVCPTAAEGLLGNWQYTCYSYVTAANPGVTATLANPGTGTVVTLTNTTGFSLPFYWYSRQNAWTLVP